MIGSKKELRVLDCFAGSGEIVVTVDLFTELAQNKTLKHKESLPILLG